MSEHLKVFATFSGTLPHDVDPSLLSMPLSEFLSQANTLFNTNLNVSSISNAIGDHLRHAIRQGLLELGEFVVPILEHARTDKDPLIRALAEDVLALLRFQ